MAEEAVGQFSEAGSKSFDGKEGPPRGELRYSTFFSLKTNFWISGLCIIGIFLGLLMRKCDMMSARLSFHQNISG